ncbi:MAG: MFS transporter [Corynebacterium sp.]|uniref:MFS transporter n=1 Tax=Corynebacterium sp. TaxID=1720 RepID=UPI0026DB1BB0|nr:MFS transporter [Corynebacterium sp.]MDO4761713.1 MFS transporter [Corynebacterium sp.]
MSSSTRPNLTFTLLWAAQFVLLLASQGSAIAVTLTVYAASRSATVLGLMMAITYGTMIYLSPLIGTWLDRYSRKTGIMLADSTIALSSAGLAIAAFVEAGIPIVLVLVFIHSCGMSAQQLSLQATVREIRTEKNLTTVASVVALVDNIPLFVGPLIGALVYTLVSAVALFALEAVVATIVVIVVALLPFPPTHRRKAPTAAIEGFRFILTQPELRKIQASFGVVNFTHGLAVPALLAVVISTESTWPESFRLSVYNIANAAGLILGAATVLWVARRLPRSVIVVAGIVGGAVCGRLVVPLVVGIFPLVVLVSFLRNLCTQWANTPLTAFWQERTPTSIQGSVFGARRFLGQGAYPLALLVGGWCAKNGGLGTLFIVCAVVELAIAACVWRSKILQ